MLFFSFNLKCEKNAIKKKKKKNQVLVKSLKIQNNWLKILKELTPHL